MKRLYLHVISFGALVFFTGIPTVTVPLSRYTVNIGSSVTIQCTYTANPAATSVIWEKTVANRVTEILTTNNKYYGSTTQSPSLLINNIDESDEAYYVCKVTNSIGTGNSSLIFIDVLGSKFIFNMKQYQNHICIIIKWTERERELTSYYCIKE